jgi:hypothetical protein
MMSNLLRSDKPMAGHPAPVDPAVAGLVAEGAGNDFNAAIRGYKARNASRLDDLAVRLGMREAEPEQ